MTPQTETRAFKLKSGIRQGLTKGWAGLVWLLKIIIPISFATSLLVHFGIIYRLDFLLTPVMSLLGLPASAALVLVIGIFTGPYGVVAALFAMPFSMDHMILMAIFVLIAHNLIQESIVQGNSGINPFLAAVFRLVTAFIVTFICARIMGVTPAGDTPGAMGALTVETQSFSTMLTLWGWGTFKLVVQIFCIIMPLMVILELAKTFHTIQTITRLVSPLLSIMGLKQSTGMLWLTATVFGLGYGAAVIMEETRDNAFEKEDLTGLHLSIGVNHAMIEDPALFLPLGLPLFWLWIPRLAAAIVAAWLYRVFCSARRRYAKRAVHKKLCNH